MKKALIISILVLFACGIGNANDFSADAYGKMEEFDDKSPELQITFVGPISICDEKYNCVVLVDILKRCLEFADDPNLDLISKDMNLF